MSRSARRIAVIATLALLIATGPVASASAHEGPPGSRGSGLSAELRANEPLVGAVKAARMTLKTELRAAHDAFRTDTTKARDAIRAATAEQREALKAAAAAYRTARVSGSDVTAARAAFESARANYLDALRAARTAQQAGIDAALAKARAARTAAVEAYVSALRAAFAEYAPGQAVPENLLNPKGGHWLAKGIGGRSGEAGARPS
jgi:hypothetical protein